MFASDIQNAVAIDNIIGIQDAGIWFLVFGESGDCPKYGLDCIDAIKGYGFRPATEEEYMKGFPTSNRVPSWLPLEKGDWARDHVIVLGGTTRTIKDEFGEEVTEFVLLNKSGKSYYSLDCKMSESSAEVEYYFAAVPI